VLFGTDGQPMREATDGTPTPTTDRASRREPAIVARGMRRVFGDEVAVERLDLDVPTGLIFGFVGPSGSGKTTAVRMLAGIDRPTDGAATVLGCPTTRFDRALQARIGYLPQRSVQFPNLTVQENLDFVASLYGLPLRRRDAITAALEETELVEHRRKPVRALSGGMKRRLALSAALIHRPELVFLDEPTAGIDPVLRSKIWARFEALRDEGRTLFVTTQYVSETAYCDRVAVLARGRIIAEDTPTGLRRRALGGDVIELTPTRPLDEPTITSLRDHDGVREVARVGSGDGLRLVVDDADHRLPQLQEWTAQQQVDVDAMNQEHVSFDEVFTILVDQHTDAMSPAEVSS
jgi:ABC-2 type transport system ATP-binding protein